ncbi:unnamed protein product [Ostreobium quekettii]|uniref:Chitobiosyldiphosphodolichol beta-mannosyltransferase n=1 Tax=Ostreobium quekettii TaxID=121088 RepID=A0A8S1J0T0_9CHLO|nr:unnamed protein product [Ostreobium quekettii]
MGPRRVCWVVVLGDFGRSPRMQYHAQSLASHGNDVHVVALPGSRPISSLAGNPRVKIHPVVAGLPPWAGLAPLRETVVGTAHPLVRLAEAVERAFGRTARYSFCVTAAMAGELRAGWGVEAVVLHDRPPDRFRPAGPAEAAELFGKLRNCLMEGMHKGDICRAFLSRGSHPKKGGSQEAGEEGGGEICYETKETCSAKEAAGANGGSQQVGGEGGGELEDGAGREGVGGNGDLEERTLVTCMGGAGLVALREDRPGIVVSSTSWTPDEDFSILLEAAGIYDCQCGPGHPPLVILVTGKGPLREAYRAKMQKMEFRNVAFRTVWLEPDDYPILLGCADLGVSLHTSSSGLDLPMKVVDMFGCHLPVCAASYSCISELVSDGVNGLLFSGAQELAQQLLYLFEGFPHDLSDGALRLVGMRRALQAMEGFSWTENWDRHALPVFQAAAGAR